MGVAVEIWKEGIFGIGCLTMSLMLSLGLVSKNGAHGTQQGRSGPRKKKSVKWLGWVRVCKNPAQTQPVAIPNTNKYLILRKNFGP